MPIFSKDPQTTLEANLAKFYAGVRLTQGVPVLDRDLTLQGDLLDATLRRVLHQHLGQGTPRGPADQFKIVPLVPAANDFAITGGRLLTRGIDVEGATTKYSSQGLPALTPTAGLSRVDVIYLDVWLAVIDCTSDAALFNPDDYELETSVRLLPRWAVRVAQNATLVPAPQPGHVHYLLAQLSRPANTSTITASMLADQRRTRLDLAGATGRVTLAESAAASMKSALAPAFAASPYSRDYAYPGLCVTLRGRRFLAGPLAVELRRTDAEIYAPWISAPLVGEAEPNAVTVRIPNGVAGSLDVALTNGIDRVLAPAPLYVYGPPRFDARGPQITPQTIDIGATVTLHGEFFDMPGAIVEVAQVAEPIVWKAVTIVSATSDKLLFKAPLTGGEHMVRVRTLASDLPAISLETLTLWLI
ncbi:hypothetical protein [Nannocystis punicea]|uniref:IPT/TIG domain-containing protein n=1 Tax=Nannocystis punicea TaxID=2995304 RepID=A0ABY7GVR7_9BACT|nr:hypothetical protein [Nannocystis poenicansa]WAS91047.1 hypothetical protein O0S08_33075 [Nannocystis poenicansa]